MARVMVVHDMRPASREEEVPPNPAALIESMRAFGYSLPAAIADLVDNSITAGARNVWIDFRWEGRSSSIAITDDGIGMGQDLLTNAMRLGSRSPQETRSPGDLGRFGLGLKTAAFSQGRVLTVASRETGGSTSTRTWDLDHVTRTGKWSLLVDRPEDAMRGGERLSALASGTCVTLGGLDRLVGADSDRDRWYEHARSVEQHLSMVFHRFLSGRGSVALQVGESRVQPWDPYLSEHIASQALAPEPVPFQDGRVMIQPWVLPYFSKLDRATHVRAEGPLGWNAHQGLFVYRAKRLLVPGGYLGLPFRQEDHYKLARIQVDLETSMDLSWQIDVRKASARIPEILRADFERIVRRTRARAAEAYRFRGQAIARGGASGVTFTWQRRELRHGAIRYVINRKHPLIAAALEASNDRRTVERALKLAEETLPTTAIAMDNADDPARAHAKIPFHERSAEVAEMLRLLHAGLVKGGADPMAALSALADVEPFQGHGEIVAALAEELQQ